MTASVKFWFLRARLVYGLVVILCITGIFAWFNINEQEDPFFPYRNAFISVIAPGMSADAIENTIVKPLERTLAAVDELDRVRTSVSDGVASINIGLQETTYNTAEAWQRVREQVNNAKSRAPAAVTVFELQDKAQDTAGILFAINTKKSLIDARQFALYLRDELFKISSIRDVNIIGDPGMRAEIFYPQELMLETGISPLSIASQVSEAHSQKTMGVLRGSLYESNITPITRLNNLENLTQVDIKTNDGEVLKLSQITRISTSLNPNSSESFWINGQKKLGLSIVLPPNKTRVIDLGKQLMKLIEKINAEQPDYIVEPIFFQPKWTEKRSDELAKSLLLSSIGVGLVLFILMSKKLALVVSITVPAIALSSLAFFGIFGGVLHQMSIAGMVISLGLMVDNSIVMSELIARYRKTGMPAIEASNKAIRELYKPLATSTLTTIAAFVPMLLAQGDVADFIKMVPVVVTIAIFISYAYALVLLPTITMGFKQFNSGKTSRVFEYIGSQLSSLGTSNPKSVIMIFVLILITVHLLTSEGSEEFFPKSSRNQAFIDIQGDYGLSHDATLKTVKLVEGILNEYPEVTGFASFIGNSGPRFYYNMPEAPNEPNIARVVFETASNHSVPGLVKTLNRRFESIFKSTRVNAKEIGQGPPIEAPIEIRVLGDDREILLSASEEIFTTLNSHPETTNTRRGYVTGKPKLQFVIDDNLLQKAKLSRPDVSAFVSWRTSGIHLGSIATERENLSMVLLDNPLQIGSDPEYLMNTILMNNANEMIPISSFAQNEFIGKEPVLTRNSGFNSRMVSADITDVADEEHILLELMPTLREIEEKYHVTLDFGGEAEEQENSGGALLKAIPFGVILLFCALIIQFNSYRIAGIIMLTIPLAMLGVKPMLSIAGVSFGFMSVMGILTLTGIVVNTAIILIDKVIVKVKEEQLNLQTAISEATKERIRPVLLTAITTIVGMIPLTAPNSPLWAPMAWTIIGGLITSTILTLIVLPSALMIFINESKIRGE